VAAAAQRKVQVAGQILLIDPPITRLPIRFGKYPTIAVTSDGDSTLMYRGVMPPTKQDQIAEVRAATQNPRNHMMGIQMPGLMTARILAHLVPDQQRATQRLAHQATGAAQRQHLAMLVDQSAEHRVVAGQPLRGRRFDRPDPVNVADRRFRGRPPGNALDRIHSGREGFRRSRGNVFGQVLRRHLSHHQGAVLTGAILGSGVQKHPGHIQQGVHIAVPTGIRRRL
jgi:hypothetical protein